METDDPSGNRKLAGLLLFGAAGLGLLIYKTARDRRRIRAEWQNVPPVDPDVVAAEFEGIPLYPGAELDGLATAQMRWTAAFIAQMMSPWVWVMARLFGPGMASLYKGVPAVYTVDAPAAKVLAWYHTTLKAAGWEYREVPEEIRKRLRGRDLGRQYKRGEEELDINAREAIGDGQTRLELTRG